MKESLDLVEVTVDLSPEMFLDALDAAAEQQDREAMSALAKVAFERRNLLWQAAVRHADNYIVAVRQGNAGLQESCQNAFMALVPKIRNQ